jgi:hypothetical protein
MVLKGRRVIEESEELKAIKNREMLIYLRL